MSGSNSGSNTSKMAVPQAKEAMNRFKQEVASEIGVPLKVSREDLLAPGRTRFSVLAPEAGERMQAAIAAAKADRDSLGGIIECGVVGLPAGLGDPMLDGMENRIARLAFAIPAVKGVEFGAGFGVAALRGSQNNARWSGPR